MITLVISGGQTGADQAGWRAARAFDIATGGWIPQYYRTENGTDGSLGRLYNAKTLPNKSDLARTFKNVLNSDGTIWFGRTDIPGSKTTLEACKIWRRPVLIVEPNRNILPSDAVRWLRNHPNIRILNIAGNRESQEPGMGAKVERFLIAVFKRVRQPSAPSV
jgi:hypothetical protein